MGGRLATSRPLATVFANERRSRETAARGERSTGYVTLAVVDSIKERCLKDLLHGAIFHATCLAMMICAALQLQGEGCHTLQRVCAFFSIKLIDCICACARSRCYGNIARQVAERVLHDATLKKIVEIVAESRTRFYFVQRLVQLVSQRFWPLHSMLHGAMVRATCLATILTIAQHVTRCNGPCNLSRNDFDHCTVCYTVQRSVQVAWKIAPCNRAFTMVGREKKLTLIITLILIKF